jgi:arylsulfatase
MIFSADDGCDVGRDTGSPVSQDYGPRDNEFSGEIEGVALEIADAADSEDHLVSADEIVRVAMARQ